MDRPVSQVVDSVSAMKAAWTALVTLKRLSFPGVIWRKMVLRGRPPR